jgi:hypothetical protein
VAMIVSLLITSNWKLSDPESSKDFERGQLCCASRQAPGSASENNDDQKLAADQGNEQHYDQDEKILTKN